RRGIRDAAPAELGPGSAALPAVPLFHRAPSPGGLRSLVREVAARPRHLLRAPAEFAQARLRRVPDLDRARRTFRDAVGTEGELLVGPRRKARRPVRAVDARLLRRAGVDHDLRYRARLAAGAGQRVERLRLERPVDLDDVLVPGLGASGDAGLRS